MEKLGTDYGGWYVPTNLNLDEKSIVYSGGVGEDISFDLVLSDKYKCNIFLIDPTKKSKIHFDEMKYYYDKNKWKLTGNIQKDYYSVVYPLKPDFKKINFLDVGLWKEEDTLKFYKQKNPDYVSQSVIKNMFGEDFDTVSVNTIKNIMKLNGHEKIDLLKLDIEGAEVAVLTQMLDNKIYPKYLCIEFDLYLKKKDTNNETQKIVKRLEQVGYKILKNDNLNITFMFNV